MKVRQEQEIKPDGAISASQYVGISIPEKNINFEEFRTQEIPQTGTKPPSEILENQFKLENFDKKSNLATGQEDFSQAEEKI